MSQDEIEEAAAAAMGRFVGQLISDELLHEIADAIEDATHFPVICSRSNNPEWQTDLGEVQADVLAPYRFVIRIEAESFPLPPALH